MPLLKKKKLLPTQITELAGSAPSSARFGATSARTSAAVTDRNADAIAAAAYLIEPLWRMVSSSVDFRILKLTGESRQPGTVTGLSQALRIVFRAYIRR
jgi:hypothetical protein